MGIGRLLIHAIYNGLFFNYEKMDHQLSIKKWNTLILIYDIFRFFLEFSTVPTPDATPPMAATRWDLSIKFIVDLIEKFAGIRNTDFQTDFFSNDDLHIILRGRNFGN